MSSQFPTFRRTNVAFNTVFRPGRLSIGLVVPIERYDSSPTPLMAQHLNRARLAEKLGFASLWLRDVPFNVPAFGDAGQMYDPFVYLGTLAGLTERIALGVASLILPLRHPAHIAKAAASVDVLSKGRLLLGVASGDRPEEYPAMALPYQDRGDSFRESFTYIRRMADPFPQFDSHYGKLNGGLDMLPKPTAGTLPLLVTGGSRQDPDWTAQHADGWITYPRSIPAQEAVVGDWRARVQAAGEPDKPVVQSLYVDLLADPDAPPTPIHLGFRSGIHALRDYLTALQQIGVNHVALNLRFNQADIEETLHRLAEHLLPDFATEDTS